MLEAGEKPVTIAGAQVFTDPKEAKDWLARPSGNVLILQPLRELAPSVLFVRTVTADGQERHYSFELRTREGSVADPADKAAYMTVQFGYRKAPTSGADRRGAGAAGRWRRERVTKARLEQAAANAPRNYAYSKRDPQGCPLLAPIYVFDDGSRTTLVFAPHAVLPEIYTINQDGKEAIATTINDTTARPGCRSCCRPSSARCGCAAVAKSARCATTRSIRSGRNPAAAPARSRRMSCAR